MKIRREFEKRMAISDKLREEELEIGMVTSQVMSALRAMWLFLDVDKEKAPLSYDAIRKIFGGIDRRKVEEVLDYAVHDRAQKRLKAVEDSE